MSLPAPGDLLGAAQAGDHGAFDLLIRPHRRELLAHCYRMLGSIHDADDALQDTLLRAWRGISGFAGRSSLRTWLYRIATNAAIALAQRKGRHQLATDEDPPWLEPYTPQDEDATAPATALEQRESLEIAFIVAVQHLPPKERAVLLLRDALGFSAEETAEILDVTVAAVTSRLQRARGRIRTHHPDQQESQQVSLQRLGDQRQRDLVSAYVSAWETADPDAIISLITQDATFSMPPEGLIFRGRLQIRDFLLETPLRFPWRLIPTQVAGQLAFGNYTLEGTTWVAHSLDVITLRGEQISRITAFINPSLLPALGLPERLEDTV